jgi:predicted transcriptional regulator
MNLSAHAIKALARVRNLDPVPAVAGAGFGELLEAGLVERTEDDRRGRGWVLTEEGRSFPLNEVRDFRSALSEVLDDEVALDRARRARNNAAARLAGKLSLTELGEIAGVSKQRVAQWAAEAEEEK